MAYATFFILKIIQLHMENGDIQGWKIKYFDRTNIRDRSRFKISQKFLRVVESRCGLYHYASKQVNSIV